jgi:ABC-type methionine transport system permease subunit
MYQAYGFFGEFFIQLPLLVTYLVGVMAALYYWGKSPKASMWTLLAFGLALLLCLVIPVGQRITSSLFMNAGYDAQRVLYFIAAFFWSVLRAIPYLLLLMGVYAGRQPAAK